MERMKKMRKYRQKEKETEREREREKDGDLHIHYFFGYCEVYINNIFRTLLCK